MVVNIYKTNQTETDITNTLKLNLYLNWRENNIHKETTNIVGNQTNNKLKIPETVSGYNGL